MPPANQFWLKPKDNNGPPPDALHELADLKFAIDQAAIVTISDPQGGITYVNDMALRIYGYRREELMGKNHRALNSGVHPKEFFRELWKTILSGSIWRGEICNKAKDGSLHWLDTTIIPFMGHDRRPYKFMSIRKDITARKRMEESLEHEQRKRSSIERLSAIGEMTANIAHEIRNPLTAINLQSQLLIRQGANGTLNAESAVKCAERIRLITGQIEKIVAGLLSLSRDAETDPFELVPVSQLISTAMDFCASNLEKHKIILTSDQPGEDMAVLCRPVQISQVLLNLINNSRDAIESLDEKWIHLSAHRAGDYIQILVSDSGTGLTPKIRARLMEPFFTTKKNGKGTGLGLSISRKILEKHGGDLLLADTKNTCFIVKLSAANGA